MSSSTYGAIKLATAEDVGAVLKKKMGTQTGYKPKEWADTINLLGKLPTKTATGSIAHFTDGADDVPLKSCLLTLNPLQTGTGDPSPTNPRPITGFTGVTVHVADGESPHVVDNTYPISWQTEAGTVYGGELKATTGVLRVTHGKIVLDGTQSLNRTNWRPTANSVGWIYPYSLTNNKTATSQQTPNMYADTLPTVRYGLLYDGIVGIGVYTSNELGLVVMHSDTSLTTSTAVNAYLSENPITVVYELATPTEVQLTPQEVRTLLGENNIYHDGNGDSTVEYRADIDLLINELGG